LFHHKNRYTVNFAGYPIRTSVDKRGNRTTFPMGRVTHSSNIFAYAQYSHYNSSTKFYKIVILLTTISDVTCLLLSNG